MHRNPLYVALITLLTLIVLSYAGYALFQLWQFTQFDTELSIEEIRWEVTRQGEDRFQVAANYSYRFKGRLYRSHEVDLSSPHRNPWVAEERQTLLQNQQTHLWIRSDNPNRSTLQKSFPLKECISAALLVLLLLYFMGLGWYVAKYGGS